MLHLEQLETRCLLSIFVTNPPESGGLHTLDFDVQPVGTDMQMSVEIFNDGPATQIDFSLTDFNANPDDFTLSATSLAFNAGEMKSITLTFSPDAIDNYDEVLNIENVNDIFDFVKVSVTGSGDLPDLNADSLRIDSMVIEGYVFNGADLSVTATIENSGPFAIPAQTTRFYLSSDAQFDAGSDLLLGSDEQVGVLEPGNSFDVSLDLVIPGSVVEGNYHVIAVADAPGDLEESNEVNNVISSNSVFFSDSGLLILDSVNPADDHYIPYDPVLLGGISESETVFVTNITNGIVTVTDVQLDTSSFTVGHFIVENRAELELPPGFEEGVDAFVPVELNSTISTELLQDDDHNWYSFIGFADQLVQIETETNTQLGNPFDTELRIFTQYGDELAWNDDIDYPGGEWDSRVTFVTPYNGLYYIDLDSFWNASSGPTDIEIYTLDEPINELLLSGQPTSTQGILQSGPFSNGFAWFKFEAFLRAEVQITAAELGASDVVITVYNDLGQIVHTQDVNGETFEFTAEYSGNFYIKLESSSDIDIDNPFRLELVQLNVGETAWVDINPGETVSLPVWFTPKEPGFLTDTLTLISNVGANNEVALSGQTIPGDLVVRDMEVSTQEFAGLLLPGLSMDVMFDLYNDGPGIIFSDSDVSFYLSTDEFFDPNDDTLLDLTNSNETGITVGALAAGQFVSLETSLDIPLLPSGFYHVLVVADPEDVVGEIDDSNNTLASEPLMLDGNDLVLFDSLGDAADGILGFDEQSIGTTSSVEYIGIYNRGEFPVTIDAWELQHDRDFHTITSNTPDSDVDNLVVQPGQIERIFMFFSPDTFENVEINNLISDELTIQFENVGALAYAIAGGVSGPDLVVKESAGAINDDKVEFGKISINQIGEEIITLQNIGDVPLVVNILEFGLGDNSPFSIMAPVLSEEIVLPAQPPEGSTDPDLSFTELVIGVRTDLVGEFFDTLIIHSSDNLNNGIYVVQLSAEVIAPQLNVEEDAQIPNDNTISFGSLPLNQPSQTETVRLNNTGNDTLVINDLRFAEGSENNFAFAPPALPLWIEPGTSFDVAVQFLTPEAAGAYTDTLVIDHSDGQIHLVNLEGLAADPTFQIILANGTTFDGDTLFLPDTPLTHTTSQIFSIFNSSTVEVIIDSITIAGEGFSLIDPLGGNSMVLAQGDTIANLVVRFDALAGYDVETFNGTLDIKGTHNREINVVTETVTPQINFPNSQDISGLNFGSVEIGQQATRMLKIENEGSSPLLVTNWFFSDQQFRAVGVENGLEIAAGQAADIEVLYVPNQVNAFSGSDVTLSLATNDLDAQDSLITINLTGESPGNPFPLLANTTAGFFDSDGDLVQVTITDGQGLIYLDNGLGSGADINTLRVIPLEEDEPATVKIVTRGGQTTVGSIIAEGNINAILGSRVNIDYSIDIAGSLDQLVLNNIHDGAEISTAEPSFKPITIKANHIGDNVNFDLASMVKTFQAASYGENGQLSALSFKQVKIIEGNFGADLFARNHNNGSIDKVLVEQDITGNLKAWNDIGKVISRQGGIQGDIFAGMSGIEGNALPANQAALANADNGEENDPPLIFGNIEQLKAKTQISGTIVALDNIKKVDVAQGTLSATMRAENIQTIRALNFDQAIISAADLIGNVTIGDNVLDSHVLSGYDIGLDGIVGSSDDDLTGGDIGRFSFGGRFANTHVAVGVVPIFSDLLPPRSGPDSSGQGSIGSTSGNTIDFNNGGQLFGFYYAEELNTQFRESGDFVIVRLFS